MIFANMTIGTRTSPVRLLTKDIQRVASVMIFCATKLIALHTFIGFTTNWTIHFAPFEPPNGLRNPQGRERKTINLIKIIKLFRRARPCRVHAVLGFVHEQRLLFRLFYALLGYCKVFRR